MKPETVLARLLLASAFLVAGGYRLWLAYRGAPLSNGTLVLSAAEVGLGLAIAAHWRLRLAAGVAMLALLADAVLSHPFWQMDTAARSEHLLHFMKNLGLVGGLLLLLSGTSGKRR